MARQRVRVLLLRPQVLPRGLPGDAGHAQRAAHAHGLPREHRRDGEGPRLRRGRGRRLRPLHPVRRVRAALPQHALHRRLLPPPHPHGRRGQGDARADGRDRQRACGLEALERAPRGGRQRAGAGRRAGEPGARARLGRRPRHPHRGRDDPVRRLRGRLLPHLVLARLCAAAPEGGRRVRPDGRAVVLRRAGRGDGLRRAGTQACRPQRGRLARRGRQAHPGARSARLHRLHRGLSEVLRRRLRLRDRARCRADRRAGARRAAGAYRAGRAQRHLPRPLPAQQAQGRARAPAGAATGDPGSRIQGRGPRDTVVLLLGRWWRSADREAGDHCRDQPAARGARRATRGGRARERVSLVGAPAVGGGGGRARRDGPVRAGGPLRGDRGGRATHATAQEARP